MADKLQSIARSMRAEAIRNISARWTLQRGLYLELWAGRDRKWRLRLARGGEVEASDQEVAIIRRAFGIPEDAEERKTESLDRWITWPMDPPAGVSGDG